MVAVLSFVSSDAPPGGDVATTPVPVRFALSADSAAEREEDDLIGGDDSLGVVVIVFFVYSVAYS